MNGGKALDKIKITLRDRHHDHRLDVWVDVYDNGLSRRWLSALDSVLKQNLILEKNFCFLGFSQGDRSGRIILDKINDSIDAINQSHIGYTINDRFEMSSVIVDDDIDGRGVGRNLVHDRFNRLHRYFEDLQGVSGNISIYYQRADSETRWHIRQLNLLCHEFESWALSYRKEIEAPEWQRPSQLMCWLQAPRFELLPEDYELFGIETLSRNLGGVYLGVNKAVGKHHWEVFNDEGNESRIDQLTTSALRNQTEAAADFDIEWGQDPSRFEWQQNRMKEFRAWLINNGFDPNDPALTIGHPKIAQVDLVRSFGTEHYQDIWKQLNTHLDVVEIDTGRCCGKFDYHWSDPDFKHKQIAVLRKDSHEMVD